MANKPSLLPKEHGAYAELAFPLITGLALAVPSLPALALGAAAVAFFLANEPMNILLGARGRRLKDDLGGRARTRGTVLLGTGIFLGALGVGGAGASVWPELLAPALAGVLLLLTILAGRQKTLWGEFLVVTAFSTLLLPLASASGAESGRAVAATAVWWVSFALGTLEVHAIKTRHKNTGRNQWTRWGSPLASGMVVLGVLALVLGWWGLVGGGVVPHGRVGVTGSGLTPWGVGVAGISPHLVPSAWALLLPAAAILVLALMRVHPRRLKRVGWTLVGANTLALIILLAG
jgi:hypothetical protein